MRKIAKDGGNQYYPELGDNSHKLFRKGAVGEWKEYFSERNLCLVNKIIEGSPPFYVKFLYFFLFTLRRKIGLIESS